MLTAIQHQTHPDTHLQLLCCGDIQPCQVLDPGVDPGHHRALVPRQPRAEGGTVSDTWQQQAATLGVTWNVRLALRTCQEFGSMTRSASRALQSPDLKALHMKVFSRKTNSSTGLRELPNQGPAFPHWAEGNVPNSASGCFLNQACTVLLLPHSHQLIQPPGVMCFEARFGRVGCCICLCSCNSAPRNVTHF